MRISELLGVPVIDASGQRVGVVQDLRASREIESSGVGTRGRLRIVGLVTGGDGIRDRIAHGWGFAEDRARGPWILRRLARRAIRRSRFVASSDVASWGPGEVRLSIAQSQLAPLKEVLTHEQG